MIEYEFKGYFYIYYDRYCIDNYWNIRFSVWLIDMFEEFILPVIALAGVFCGVVVIYYFSRIAFGSLVTTLAGDEGHQVRKRRGK